MRALLLFEKILPGGLYFCALKTRKRHWKQRLMDISPPKRNVFDQKDGIINITIIDNTLNE